MTDNGAGTFVFPTLSAGTGLVHHTRSTQDVFYAVQELTDHLTMFVELMDKRLDVIEDKCTTLENLFTATQKLLAGMTAPLAPRTIWDAENKVGSVGLVESHLASLNFESS